MKPIATIDAVLAFSLELSRSLDMGVTELPQSRIPKRIDSQ